MKVKVLFLFFLLAFPAIGFSQHKRHSSRKPRDYPVISMGPEITGNIFYDGSLEQEANIYFNYSYGGFIVLRPLRGVGLESALDYGRWINGYPFYEIPVLLQFYGSSNTAVKLGPLFNFPIIDDPSKDDNEFLLGLRLGAGSQLAGFYIDFTQNRLLGNNREFNPSFMIGLGFKFRLVLLNF